MRMLLKLNVIAIIGLDYFNRPPLNNTNMTRICFKCNQSIHNELAAIERGSSCMELNMLTTTRSLTCLFCNAEINIHQLKLVFSVNVFVSRNI